MAKNDHENSGRSLEEQVASLDAMNDPAPEAPAAEAPPEPDDPAPPNPWPNAPAPPFPPQGQPPFPYPPDSPNQPPPFPGAPGFGPQFPVGPPPEPGSGPSAQTEAYVIGPMRPGGPPPPEAGELTQQIEHGFPPQGPVPPEDGHYGPPPFGHEQGPPPHGPVQPEDGQYGPPPVGHEQGPPHHGPVPPYGAPPPGGEGPLPQAPPPFNHQQGPPPQGPVPPEGAWYGAPQFTGPQGPLPPEGARYAAPRFNRDEGPPPPGAAPQHASQYAAPPFTPEAAPPGEYGAYAPHSTDSLSSDMLLRGRRDVPAGGWRRMVYKASGGAIHPGESAPELRRRELLAHARTPVSGGHYRVAVMSLKGGVGKTTTTVGLGATLASVRGDRVIAVDANPDRGTLSDKVRLETPATVRDLVNEHQNIQRYADVRAFTSQAPSRLEVLASDRDPAASEAFSEEDYRTVTRVLENFYSICITDCGTGLLHSAMAGVLGLADQLILVSSPSVDGARSASATLDWLEAHRHGDLVRGGVVVLSMVRPRSRSTVDIDRLQAHFESRCRAVVRIPYDPHLEEGAEVDLDQLAPVTQDAYLMLAAAVADAFAWSPAR